MVKSKFVMRKLALLPLCLFLVACSKDPVPSSNQPAAAEHPAGAEAPPNTPLTLTAVYPFTTKAGKPFNVQPDGTSALGVACTGTAVGAVKIVIGTRELPTVHGTGCGYTSTIPPEVFASPGTFPIYLKHGGGESNKKDFIVTP